MAFDWISAGAAGLGALGDIFGSIGDQGYGAGERLQPEFVSLQSSQTPQQRGFLTPMQADVGRMLYQSLMNPTINNAIANLAAGRAFNAPVFAQAQPQMMPVMYAPASAYQPAYQPSYPAEITSLAQIDPNHPNYQNFVRGYQATGVMPSAAQAYSGGYGPRFAQNYNTPQAQVATKAAQLGRMLRG